MKIKQIHPKKLFYISSTLTVAFLIFTSFTYFKHATTFHFVDEYTNMVAAYFMDHGRRLYTDIFFHHQMLMPYISYVYQLFVHPNSLYELIVHHRLIVIAFAFIANLLLIYRFRYVGIGFALFFEPLKYYLFGNLFLAESFIIYPIIYLLGLVWESFSKKKIHMFELILASICTWFVVFMREPFIPLVAIMYAILLWRNRPLIKNVAPISTFLLLTFLILCTVSLKDFIYQVITVNATYVVPVEVTSNGKIDSGLISFFYPIYILFESGWNFYRTILIGLDITFLLAIGYLIYKKYTPWKIVLFLVLLGLGNIRWVGSTVNFYVAYHAIVWFGMFCFTLFIFVKEIYQINKKAAKLLLIPIALLFLSLLVYPKTYLWENVNREEAFTINYSKYYTNGIIMNILSEADDTVFIDYWDSLIYWQTKRDSSYKYAFYYPVTSSVPEYAQERTTMFAQHPPDFYYIDCGKQTSTKLIPPTAKDTYIQLINGTQKTCLYMKKSKVSELTEQQINDIKTLNYSLPKAANLD